jgi:hypothetical protein
MAESKAHHATDGRSELEGQVKADATPTRPGATPPGSTRAGAPTSVEHTEPEEQFESGGKQQQQREVLQENVAGGAGQAERHPEQVAGQHATGSFTGTAEEPEDPSK